MVSTLWQVGMQVSSCRNTSSKVAVYNKRHMEASFVFKKFDVEVVSSIFKKYPLTKDVYKRQVLNR